MMSKTNEMEEFSLEETDEDVDAVNDLDESSTSDSDSDFEQSEAPTSAKKRQKLSEKSSAKRVINVKPKSTKSPVKPAAKSGSEDIRDPEAHVLEYMRRTNRPYSVLNVYENLHRNIPKTMLTRHLDSLVTNEQLVGKVYGKTKIYYVNQMGIQLPSEEQRRETEDDIKKIEGDCAAMEKKSRDAEALLASIHSEISDENLNVKIESLEKEIETIQQVVDQFDGKERVIIPPEQKQRLKQNFTKFRAAWISRKRLAMDAVEQIAEGMEKKPKDVLKLCDIETDAEYGISSIPSALVV